MREQGNYSALPVANACREEVKLMHRLLAAEAERSYVNPVIYSLFGFILFQANVHCTMDYSI